MLRIVNMLYVLVLIGFILILCVVHHLVNNNEKARLIRKLPGLRDHFLIGNAWHVLALQPVELFRLGRVLAAKFNGIYKFYAYPHASVNIYNPDDVEVVISTMKHHEKSEVYKFMRPWLRDGLLLSSGQKWQQRRKILTSAFHFNVLRQYFINLEENALWLIEYLKNLEEESTNVTSIISEYTLNSICESAMGTRLETSTSGRAYKDAIYEIGNILYERFINIYLYPEFLFKLTSLAKEQSKVLSKIHNFTANVISSRKHLVENGEIDLITETDDNDVTYLNNKKKKSAMLDSLIAAERDGLVDNIGIQEEVDTFMFEGHDTTAAGLTFLLMLMANNPSEQVRAVHELREIFGDTRRATTIDDLNKMHHLERCIKEALRLYPPVHFISRRLCETVKLSNYIVPEGTSCHIHIFDLHRRPDIYEDPLKFDPDRFLPENSKRRHNFAYIPFSAGPRNCIGQKFAMMEMKSALCAILRNFELMPVTAPADIKLASSIVLRNSQPIYVKFIRRRNII